MATAARTRIESYTCEGQLINLFVTDCAWCGVLFALTSEYRDRRRADRQTFHCPNGHPMTYHTTEADQLRRRLESTEASLAENRELLAGERKQHAATKGKLTKTIRRAAAGVCPACTRTFQNVQRHIATKHPEIADA